MINNSEQIRGLLKFEENDFYFVQIFKRRKDNPDMERNSSVIKNFYIDSIEDYDRLVPKIIDVCDKENARAYIRLNKRNYKHLGMKMIKRVVDYISSDNHKSLRNAFDAVAGEFHSDKDKKWVLDVDWSDDSGNDGIFLEELIHFITQLQVKTGREPMYELIPTKNGAHIITRPFNKMIFKEKYPNIEIKTDNPTILYCP